MTTHPLARKSEAVVYVVQVLTEKGWRNKNYELFKTRRDARIEVGFWKRHGQDKEAKYRVARYEMTGAGR